MGLIFSQEKAIRRPVFPLYKIFNTTFRAEELQIALFKQCSQEVCLMSIAYLIDNNVGVDTLFLHVILCHSQMSFPFCYFGDIWGLVRDWNIVECMGGHWEDV